MTRFLPTAGTHGWRGDPVGDWWQRGSQYLRMMREHEFAPYAPDRPFVWTTSLDGLWPWPWQRAETKHLTWRAAGLNKYAYLVPPIYGGAENGIAATPMATRLVDHSHAGNVTAYACAAGLYVHVLITIGTPVRDDMAEVWAQARPRIGTWVHVHSDSSDWWQVAGGLFDGKLGIDRKMPLADVNIRIPRVGHTGILTDPTAFGWWEQAGLLEYLRG